MVVFFGVLAAVSPHPHSDLPEGRVAGPAAAMGLIALLGALLSAGYRGSIDGRLDGIPESTADTAREGIANAVEAAPRGGSHARDLVHAAQQSFVDGWQQAMWAGVAVMGALFVHIALRGPGNVAPVTDDGTEAAARRLPTS